MYMSYMSLYVGCGWVGADARFAYTIRVIVVFYVRIGRI
jgi:hypothetical protein